MVPLGNVAFTFPFMPEHQPLHARDIAGLVVIMLGLFVYRFLADVTASWNKHRQAIGTGTAVDELKQPLISSDTDNCDDLDREV